MCCCVFRAGRARLDRLKIICYGTGLFVYVCGEEEERRRLWVCSGEWFCYEKLVVKRERTRGSGERFLI